MLEFQNSLKRIEDEKTTSYIVLCCCIIKCGQLAKKQCEIENDGLACAQLLDEIGDKLSKKEKLAYSKKACSVGYMEHCATLCDEGDQKECDKLDDWLEPKGIKYK